jgi:hypothetical protein
VQRQRHAPGVKAQVRARRVGGRNLARTVGNSWRCKVCFAFAKCARSLRVLRNQPCKGALAQRAHASHKMAETNGVVWCCVCGAYARKVLRALKRQCAGAPPTQAFRCALKRLRNGFPPAAITRKRAGWHGPAQPRPLSRNQGMTPRRSCGAASAGKSAHDEREHIMTSQPAGVRDPAHGLGLALRAVLRRSWRVHEPPQTRQQHEARGKAPRAAARRRGRKLRRPTELVRRC